VLEFFRVSRGDVSPLWSANEFEGRRLGSLVYGRASGGREITDALSSDRNSDQ
jgi:hypothetical protein